MDINDWDASASNNIFAAPNGWPEGMNYSDVNDVGREMMAVIARFFGDINGTLSTTGAANTYAVTLNAGYTAYFDGMMFAAQFNLTNSGATTINVNGIGAQSIVDATGADLAGGELRAGHVYTLRYDGARFRYDGMSGPARLSTLDVGGASTFSGAINQSTSIADFMAVMTNSLATGSGLRVQAGSSSSETALLVEDYQGNDLLDVDGEGNATLAGNFSQSGTLGNVHGTAKGLLSNGTPESFVIFISDGTGIYTEGDVLATVNIGGAEKVIKLGDW